ncbi:MAG: hypothetical protein ACREVK_07410 [Gammaproteobacteria bacterium]
MEKISAAALEPEAVDIQTFCLLHSISIAGLYKLWRGGLGPTTMKVGNKTLISREAAAAWRRRMEGATRQPGRALNDD